MRQRKVVLYELNEVPLRILDHFTDQMPRLSLSKLRKKARVYESVTEDTGHLSPWITWPTLHRGVTNRSHEISNLGQDLKDVNKYYPPVWQILTDNGVRCGVFGSLQSYPLPDSLDNYAYYVPDTFAAGPECFPSNLSAFQKFNLSMVDRSGRNVDSKVVLKDAAAFLRLAPRLGLRGRTAMKLAGQLAAEQFNSRRTVRRRTSQVQIAFDFFLQALRSEKPDMTMFFTNHVASSMHRYWPSLFPEDYETLRFSKDWCETWRGEIPFAIREADRQIGDLMQFVDSNDDYVLIVASSMGQSAVQTRLPRNSELLLNDLPRFMEALGTGPDEYKRGRAMAPDVIVELRESARDRFMQALGSLTINGQAIDAEDLGSNRIHFRFGFSNLQDDEIRVTLNDESVAPEYIGASNIQLRDAAGANAYHIPEGIVLVYDPKAPNERVATPGRISTTEIAPSLLANFNVARPSYMSKPLSM